MASRLSSKIMSISIHAPLAGCDMAYRGAESLFCPISIHAPLAGCDAGWYVAHDVHLVRISIHAPLAGCDATVTLVSEHTSSAISNPRTPCGVRRTCRRSRSDVDIVFQSTHPLRGATIAQADNAAQALIAFQSTHPLRGATRRANASKAVFRFQSTHPLRGATLRLSGAITRLSANFNPRTPCGVRLCGGQAATDFATRLFQSTHPLRGATRAPISVLRRTGDFNPRTPCGVRPARRKRRGQGLYDFNPRTPCGVRPCVLTPMYVVIAISIHAPLAGCDAHPYSRERLCSTTFQSTHPLRGATSK